MPHVLRSLTSRDFPGLRALLTADPVAHCFVASRVTPEFELWRIGGEVWGWFEDGELVSAMYAGANLVPIETTERSQHAFAAKALAQGRRCSSIVGPAAEVLPVWDRLQTSWGPAREVRPVQHLMTISDTPSVPPDPRVAALGIADIERLLPASIAMFSEEVGVSPVAHGTGAAYRARLQELLRQGRALAMLDSAGNVAFKAEVGAVANGVCQIQGVWVAPHLRGQRLAEACMASVVEIARAQFAPLVSLYVNDFNTPAVRTYTAVGFETVGTFATVLF